MTSAVESVDDRVLWRLLDKGHTRADFLDAVALCRARRPDAGADLRRVHPWTTLDGYCDLLETIEALDLVDHVAPIQLAIRLLVPAGSRLLELDEMYGRLSGAFDPATLTYPLGASRSARRRAAARGRGARRRARRHGPIARTFSTRSARWRTQRAGAGTSDVSTVRGIDQRRPVSERALVLLSGAQSGADGSRDRSKVLRLELQQAER